MTQLPPRLPLALLPTPLEPAPRLTEAWGGPTIWFKRDDLTGFELSGNKVRKLEFHLAAALEAGAAMIITCGAAQSNHCRATALAAARLGLRTRLYLRTSTGAPPETLAGNHLLHRLSGAEIVYIDPEEYRNRDELMSAAAAHLAASRRQAYVIPEGASDALGMWGFVLALQELADQAVAIGGPVAAVWHAASSAGTTAGLTWGVDRLNLDLPIVASSVGDPADELLAHVRQIWTEAAARWGGRIPEAPLEVTDAYVGGGYGVVSEAELAVQVEATALTGMIFDPTYTGKALYALHEEIRRGRFAADDHVVFWHTGGGFAAFSHEFGAVLDRQGV